MKKFFLAAAVSILIPALAPAFDFELSIKDRISSLNLEASAPDGGTRVAAALAMELRIPEDLIIKHKARTGLSWGDLSVALYISNRTGKDVDIIVRDYKKGNAWGKVAKAYGIRTDDLLTTMGKAHAASQHGKGHGKHKDKGEGSGFKEKKEHGKGKGH
ncbi:MAG: hypothetical protein A2W63_00330 [Deltaproteobacteria bacterium RIFCSPLOWO2_02_44_9]|nr:MAG: hypothetical protein A2W63_00330 [Deltaproteobacteria bacterium RIFCSPLOWO2_02_44_9]